MSSKNISADLDIDYIRTFCKDCSVNVDRENRHNLYFEMVKPHLNSKNILIEPDYPFQYRLEHKNTSQKLHINKIYPTIDFPNGTDNVVELNTIHKAEISKPVDIFDELGKEIDRLDSKSKSNSKSKINSKSKSISPLSDTLDDDNMIKNSKRHKNNKDNIFANFKRIKTKPIRYKTIYDSFGEELLYLRYKMSDQSIDPIEQVPMVKLYMITHLIIDHIEYELDSTDMENPRIGFRFRLYNRETDCYDKDIIVSVDHGILVGSDNLPIIVDTDQPLYKTTKIFDMDNNDKVERKTKLVDILPHLLVKALLLMINTMEIDLQRANINSFVATARGGKLFRMSLDQDLDIDKIDLNFKDVIKRTNKGKMHENNSESRNKNTDNPNILQNMWIAENILDALSTFRNRGNNRIDKKWTIDDLRQNNKIGKIHKKLNRKRKTVPYSSYSIMIKNLFESDILIGITAGNTFLYVIHDVKIDESGDLIMLFINPLRGNFIEVDIHTLLSGLKRVGIILDADTCSQLNSM